MSIRSLEKIVRTYPTSDGDGVKIKRAPLFEQPLADPFLMLDQLSSDNPEDFIGGFPPHPHRGMETLTYLRQGTLEHKDHLGHTGKIESGGAQWMSAARGIIHSEMPAREMQRLFGFQLWINLPAAQKMQAPQYRDVSAAEIPELLTPEALIKAIAGTWQIEGHTLKGPLQHLAATAGVLDVELNPNSKLVIPTPPQQRILVMLYEGELNTQPSTCAGQLLMYGMGDTLELESTAGAKCLVLSGTPIQEKIVHYGPFVMNSMAEIEQAIADYNQGKF